MCLDIPLPPADGLEQPAFSNYWLPMDSLFQVSEKSHPPPPPPSCLPLYVLHTFELIMTKRVFFVFSADDGDYEQ